MLPSGEPTGVQEMRTNASIYTRTFAIFTSGKPYFILYYSLPNYYEESVLNKIPFGLVCMLKLMWGFAKQICLANPDLWTGSR